MGSEVRIKKRKRSLGKECAVPECSSTCYSADGSLSGISFFKFPIISRERNRWCNLIKRQNGRDGFEVGQHTVVCEKHFESKCIKRQPGGTKKRLRKGAEPTIFDWNNPTKKSRNPPKDRLMVSTTVATQSIGLSLPECAEIISNSKMSETSTENHLEDPESLGEHTPMSETSPNLFLAEKGIQTDISIGWSNNYMQELPDHTYCFSLHGSELSADLNRLNLQLLKKQQDIDKLRERIGQLEHEVHNFEERRFCIDRFKCDDQAIQFYTGFPNYSALMAYYNYIEPKASKLQYWRSTSPSPSPSYQVSGNKKPGPKRKFSTLDELFMVLVRLKLGLFVFDICDRFLISPGHFSKIFTTWINFLYHDLKQLFPFPSQDLIRKNMPSEFSAYPTTRIIIDCTEIFVQVPSSMLAQSKTWSSYKHHNTFKTLVGITPNGQIIFISDLWGGRASDKTITRECGVLKYIQRGDNIMADRGFEIDDLLPDGVTLNCPPFLGGRAQLTAKEVQDTVNIAAVRIHVERAIGRIKNFHILDGVLPISLSPVATQIFTVCAYLTNFMPPLLCPGNDTCN